MVRQSISPICQGSAVPAKVLVRQLVQFFQLSIFINFIHIFPLGEQGRKSGGIAMVMARNHYAVVLLGKYENTRQWRLERLPRYFSVERLHLFRLSAIRAHSLHNRLVFPDIIWKFIL